MKKVLVKVKIIDSPYVPYRPAQDAVYAEDGVTVIQEAQPEVQEQAEVAHGGELLREFMSSDEDLAAMLAMEPSDKFCEVVDMTNDYDLLLAECHRKREAAYPALGDVIDAIFKNKKGNSAEMDALEAQRDAVKLQYPKPVR